MIIVKDDDTLDEALALLEQHGTVHYSDHFEYRTLSSPATLSAKCHEAIGRDEIALVAPLGEELPVYDALWPQVRSEIAAKRKRLAREWIRAHPQEMKGMMKRLGYEDRRLQ